jgi:hypothetical protein
VDKTIFRAAFPEFSNTTTYPDAQLDFWASVAEAQVVQDIWGTMYTFGVQLYVAHEITLAAQNVASSSSGGSPGQSGGIATSKTVGSASVSYDQSVTSEKDAGWWNLTRYGQQYIRLARAYGAGCVQL